MAREFLAAILYCNTRTYVMSRANFQDEINGPYPASKIQSLIAEVVEFVNASDLTEKGKTIRIGQLTSKLMKCAATQWVGLGMVNREFRQTDIYIERDGDVLNVKAMIVDTEGDSYDLEEASGKIDFMIPVEEIMRRAKAIRENQNFDD